MLLEVVLGLAIPALVSGPLYYVVQIRRFDVVAGFGCTYALDPSILMMLLISSWGVTLPLASIVVYYPKVARFFYYQSREAGYLRSTTDNALSRADYMRIFILASVDILLTLPSGIAVVILVLMEFKDITETPRFYSGWHTVHSNWAPQVEKRQAYFVFISWMSPVMAFVIFSLFGVTSDARETYRQIIHAVAERLRWRPDADQQPSRSTSTTPMAFWRPTRDMTLGNATSEVREV